MATFVYPPTVRWDYMPARPQQMLRALAALGHTSVFVTPPGDPAPGPGSPAPGPGSQAAGDLRVVGSMAEVSASLGSRPIVLYLTYPPLIRTLDGTAAWDILWFDLIDLPAGEFRAWADSLDECLAQAHLVTVVSPVLHEYVRERYPGRLEVVPNAADAEHFSAASGGPVAAPLARLKRAGPVLGFWGSLGPWVDYELVGEVTDRLSEWNTVMVGPDHSGARSGALAVLSGHPRVHLVGRVPYAELPLWAAGFDVAMVPFRVTEMTLAADAADLRVPGRRRRAGRPGPRPYLRLRR